jgi:predicted glutamine amidotransferase
MAETLALVRAMMREAGIDEPLRFAAAMTDGDNLFAFRWASDDKAPTVYYRQEGDDLLIVSEPTDRERQRWQALPAAHAIILRKGESVRVVGFEPEAIRLAA